MFAEAFRADALEAVTGRRMDIVQSNISSSSTGVIRGIHYALKPPGQAKYVSCVAGKIWDVVVDIRTDSRTFGYWEAFELSSDNRKSLFISEGLGHGFMAMEDSTVLYGCSSVFNPDNEYAVNPYDTDLGIDWPTIRGNTGDVIRTLSDKDAEAVSLADAQSRKLLPNGRNYRNNS